MSLSKERIYYLLDRYISRKISAAEENELMEWILKAEEDSEMKSYMLEIWNYRNPAEDLSYVDWDAMWSEVMQVPVVHLQSKTRNMRWLKLTAVAAVLILVLSVVYLYFTPAKQASPAHTQLKGNDIGAPSGNRSILKLADGTMIKLDSSGNGTIALQGSIRIIKQSDGMISYTGNAARGISYNTLNVPKGSKPLGVTLSDGSRVWLNVGSTLTYPTAFSGEERKVKITGEAYFEVTHNAGMPFVVQHNDVVVNVLGTHFNVNFYEDETAERITLLEGSVLVRKNKVSKLLKPGQQARINNNKANDMKVLNGVNIDEVMAWKNGKFNFGANTDIRHIMRQVSRWYNVDIAYEGMVNQRFWGSISKDVNISKVLEILEAAGGVKFKVEGRKIIVMPAS